MFRSFLASLLLVVSVGCSKSGEPMGTVQGTVTVAGQAPAERLRIAFYDSMTGKGGTGRTEPDGQFQVERPLPVGTYKVIVDRLMLNESDPAEGSLASLKIDNAYANDVSTPLSLEVEEGKNKYEITLQPPQPKKSKAR
ncbi:carboxypeptidase-like regulatory domain-containing protein [Planctomicrobium sp. SH527]|uniref:carboxypeptidase-like regulatory domain-containing protein n=1 Tax=Planctomicrobium sp. SH527 TaxID=3448123 RepID=UPI003F5AE652